MILAHSRYRGQLNVPDMFTRWVYSIVRTGLAPRSFYRAPAPMAMRRERTTMACRSISRDQFVDWIAESGHPVQRVDDYGDWLTRFQTALKALPEKQRQHSFLPLVAHGVVEAPG
jgi:fatty acid CoA ligase FadD9